MTDEQRQLVRWHLRRAQLADHKAMGVRHRVCPEPVEDVDCDGFESAGEAQAWLASNRRNLLSLLELSHQRGWDFEVWALAEAMWAYFTTGGFYDDAVRCYELAVAAAERENHPVARIRMALLLAQTFTDARSFRDADETLADARRRAGAGLDDPDRETADRMLVLAGTGLEFTGRLRQKEGRHEEARDWFDRALANAEEQHERALAKGEPGGNPRVVALQLWFLAQCDRDLGRPEAAQRRFEDALAHFKLAKDWRTGLMAEIEAALLSLELGAEGAGERAVGALELAGEIGIPRPEAEGWRRLAMLSDEPRRSAYREKAEAIFEAIGEPTDEGRP